MWRQSRGSESWIRRNYTPSQACKTSFWICLDGVLFLLKQREHIFTAYGGVGLIKTIIRETLTVLTGDLVEAVYGTNLCVLGFIFATSRWRSGGIEVMSAYFHGIWWNGTSQIHPMCCVHRVCPRIGCEIIGNRLNRAQSRCCHVLMSVRLYRIKYAYIYGSWWYGTSQIYLKHSANRVGVRLVFDDIRNRVEIVHHRFT